MGKKLRRYTEEDLARAFGRSSTPPVGAKGTQSNPYTREEFEALLEAGTWGGGYVGDEYIPAEQVFDPVIVRPSPPPSGSGSSSDGWYCPTCGHPYPPDAGSDYTRCSNCGSSVKPPSGPRPGSGSGGGGDTGGESPSPDKSSFRTTPEKLTSAAEATVQEIINSDYGTSKSACNIGVQKMCHKVCNSNELDGMLANAIVDHLESGANWQEVQVGEVQALANEGYFVVAGWKNPTPGEAGHVVVAVPGEAAYSGNWGCNVPKVMDTGRNTRETSISIGERFRKYMIPNVHFYLYDPQ